MGGGGDRSGHYTVLHTKFDTSCSRTLAAGVQQMRRWELSECETGRRRITERVRDDNLLNWLWQHYYIKVQETHQ